MFAASALLARSTTDCGFPMEDSPPLTFRGTVVHGDKRGRELGFPTANVQVSSSGALPRDGVYSCWVSFPPATTRHGATISIGANPTFDDVIDRRVEAFIHDFDADLYESEIELTVHAWLRDMVRCDTLQELIDKTAADVAASRIALTRPARHE